MTTGNAKPTLLVTVGSTLFPHLTDTILTSPFLELLSDRISGLKVQLGRAHIPTDLALRIGAGSSETDRLKGKYKAMEVDVFRYTDDFDGLVKGADLVISHAGSGSILTAIRAGKPLLVVPNTDLMDNHQAQLADELGKGGYLTVSNLQTLRQDIERFVEERGKGMKPFPEQDPSRFRDIMDEMMGFNEDHL